MLWFLRNKIFLISFLVFSFFSIGSLSQAQIFLPEPTGLSPTNNSQVTNFPINLRWNSVKGAKAGYEYEVLYQGNAIIQGKTWGEFSTSIGIEGFNFFMGSIHQWRVRACASFPTTAWGDNGDCGSSSQFISFTPSLSKLQLSSPSNGDEVAMPVKLTWNSVSGASGYRYYISLNQGGTDISGNVQSPLTEVTIKSELLTAGQTYYWQVIAESSKGKNGEISDSRSFTTTFLKPTGIAPAGPVPILVKLKWTFPANAQEFRWYIFDAKTQKEITSGSLPGSSLEYTITQDILPYNQDLKWVVQACLTSSKKCGAISDPLTFRVVSAKPEITKPEKDSQVISFPFTFIWKEVWGTKIIYQYKIPNTKIDGNTQGTSREIKKEEFPVDSAGQSYIFQVRSCQDIPGVGPFNCGDWAQRTFTTASLIVSLSADITSGQAPLTIKLTANVSGAATIPDAKIGKEATINYTFFCDSDNDKKNTSIDNNGVYITKIDRTFDKSITTGVAPKTGEVKKNEPCKYDKPKTGGNPYYAKVISQRDGIDVAEIISIQVKPVPSGLSINPDKSQSQFGIAVSFKAMFMPEKITGGEQPQDVTEQAEWISTNKDVALIDIKKGTVTCINKNGGTVQIKAVYSPVAPQPPLDAKASLECRAESAAPIVPTLPSDVEKCVNNTGGCSDRKACCLSPKEGYKNYLDYVIEYCEGKYDSSMCVAYLPYSPAVQPVVDCVKNRLKEYGNTYTEATLKSFISDCEGQYQNKIVLSNTDVAKLISEIRAAGGVNEPVTQPTPGGTSGAGNSWFSGIKCKDTAKTTSGSIDNPLCVEDFNSLINVIINFIFWAVIALSPIMMLVAGFFYMTSAGNVAKVAQANKMILYTAIGLGVILLAKGLIAIIKGVLGV